jgi:glycosyltransferase involved in cell wall biosynthesis
MSTITIDYTPAVRQSAGIGRLTREVVRALLELDSPHHFRLFCMGKANGRRTTNDGSGLAPTGIRSSFVACPLDDRWLYRLWHRARIPLPVQALAGRCDLYHATDFVLPPVLPGTPTVLTVHDLTFERDPDSAPPKLLRFLRRVVPQSVRRATHVVADSHATARDLADLYGVAAEKITVIHSGVDERFRPEEVRTQNSEHRTQNRVDVRAKYGIGDGPFILTVGTMQRRKNHLSLVRAFASRAFASRPTPHAPLLTPHSSLVIAGGTGWLYDDVLAEVHGLGLAERVKFIGFVDDADLPALYRAAAVFAFPSLYEGFGLPPLEAMACGVPVVASSVSSLPEVVGDAGLMVDPLDVDALAAALDRALNDTAWRDQAIARGLARARQFTWHRAAVQLLAVYEQILPQQKR